MFSNTVLPLLNLLYALEYCQNNMCPMCGADQEDSSPDARYRGHEHSCPLAIEINHLISACSRFNEIAFEQMPVSDAKPS